MDKLLEILTMGNPILRKKSEAIINFKKEELDSVINSLIDIMKKRNGVGIAAPQIGKSERLFIVASRPNIRYPHAPLMQPTAMINPKITNYSEEKIKDWEGCLSVPNMRGLVPRSESIEVEYFKSNGELKREKLTGFIARIFQHELDHLNGILFIDRVENKEEIFTEAEYLKLINIKENFSEICLE